MKSVYELEKEVDKLIQELTIQDFKCAKRVVEYQNEIDELQRENQDLHSSMVKMERESSRLILSPKLIHLIMRKIVLLYTFKPQEKNAILLTN